MCVCVCVCVCVYVCVCVCVCVCVSGWTGGGMVACLDARCFQSEPCLHNETEYTYLNYSEGENHLEKYTILLDYKQL